MDILKYFTSYYWLIKTIKFKRKYKMGYKEKYKKDYLKKYYKWESTLLYFSGKEDSSVITLLVCSLIVAGILAIITVPIAVICSFFMVINYKVLFYIIGVGTIPVFILIFPYITFFTLSILNKIFNIYTKDKKGK